MDSLIPNIFITKKEDQYSLIKYLLICIETYLTTKYLNWPFSFIWQLLFIFISCILYKKTYNLKNNNKIENIILLIIAIIGTSNIVISSHIYVTSRYDGTLADNYILPFYLIDYISAIFITSGLFRLISQTYKIIKNTTLGNKSSQIKIYNFKITKKTIQSIIYYAVILFIMWMPYLLIYYPGFLFGDTLGSIEQGLHISPFNNHHPFFYTLFITYCIKITQFFGAEDCTLGCALYCVIQMIFLSLIYSYYIVWLKNKFNLHKITFYILIFIFGSTTYIANYSIAMWKDPIFTASLIGLTIQLYQFIDSQGKVIHSKMWIILTSFLTVVSIFSRNNGLYIIIFVSFWIVLLLIKNKILKNIQIMKPLRNLLILFITIILFSQLITGPVYKKYNIKGEKIESVGIFMNQMARVAAYNGEMSSSDKKYMDAILPINQYKDKYRPCCIDMLKWDSQFNAKIIEKDFFKHWLSMFIKNPRTYFDAWVLQTYGFWTLNANDIMLSIANIHSGQPRNIHPEYVGVMRFKVKFKNLLNHDSLRKLFQIDEWSIPVGICYAIVFLLSIYILLLMLSKSTLMSLLPYTLVHGLMITLFIASPINYWPRYGLLIQLLVPLYVFMFIDLLKTNKNQ